MGKIRVTHVLDFLSAMFKKKNMVIQCVIAVAHIPPYESLNKYPVINNYMTGRFNLRRPKPKLSFV